MTNEKAIEVIRENCYEFNPFNVDRAILVNKALDKAIKSLKAEDVFDKIRAEILQMPTISFNMNDIYKADVLAIIDKYKTESEDKESEDKE